MVGLLTILYVVVIPPLIIVKVIVFSLTATLSLSPNVKIPLADT